MVFANQLVLITGKAFFYAEVASESFKALADGKDVFIGTKTGSGKSLSYESFSVPFLFTFRG
jgi:superfamily II DNA helicase RecQ